MLPEPHAWQMGMAAVKRQWPVHCANTCTAACIPQAVPALTILTVKPPENPGKASRTHLERAPPLALRAHVAHALPGSVVRGEQRLGPNHLAQMTNHLLRQRACLLQSRVMHACLVSISAGLRIYLYEVRSASRTNMFFNPAYT